MKLHPHIWGMTHQTWSYVIWAIWVFAIFLPLEFGSRDLLGWAPWFTFSETVKTLVRDHPWSGLLFLAVLELLLIHLLFPQNRWGL